MVLNAVPILDMVGTFLGGSFLLQQAAIAESRLAALCDKYGGADDGFLEGSREAAFLHDKVQAAVFFCHRALPSIGAQAVAVHAGETAAVDALFRD